MQPALARFLLFPPPASGARVLAGDRGARAGRAADRAVALVVERVVRNIAGADRGPDLVLAPVGERVELHHAVRRVVFLQLELGAGDGLLAAPTGDPGFLAFERARKRLDLSDMAAALAQLHAFVEGVAAEIGYVPRRRLRIGPEHAYVVAVTLADRRDHVQRVGHGLPAASRRRKSGVVLRTEVW